MIRDAGFDGAGVRFADFQYAKTVTALQNPRVKKRLEDSGLRIVGGAPERPGDLIRTETEPWARVIKANNIKANNIKAE